MTDARWSREWVTSLVRTMGGRWMAGGQVMWVLQGIIRGVSGELMRIQAFTQDGQVPRKLASPG